MDRSESFQPEKSSNDEWVRNRLAALRPSTEWQPNVDIGLALLKRGGRSVLTWRQRGIYALASVALTGILLAFPLTRVLAKRCMDACVAGTSAVGQVLGLGSSVPTERSAPVNIRKIAPEFHLMDSNGHAVELATFRGRVVVLNFWATWCGPCKVEIPWFMEFQQRFRDDGLTVLGVSMDEDGWKSVRPYIVGRKVQYPVTIGNDDLTKAYGGIEVLPMTFLIDKTGRIAAKHTGLVAKSTYEEEIKRLMAE